MKKLIIIMLVLLPSIVKAECKYNVSEIDDLRDAVKERYLYGTTYTPPGVTDRFSIVYDEQEMNSTVEERVRTYMKECIYAKDIYEADKPKDSRGE